ncbi:MAG: LON peptidase substrate-binding domain-containing protein [Gemmatimonadetes bacterium]|nr:LON peptidase substrate-binding domain-containing protein [Gemmatimonadota bacterium]
MLTLSLFPLPVVLFPGTCTPLHIFEPRYQKMVAESLAGDRRFGLIYHDSDDQGPFLGEPGRVGCVAHIDRFEPLDDGRSLIMVRGMHRFRIDESLDSSVHGFYRADVAPFEDVVRPRREAVLAVRIRTLGLLHRVLSAMPEPPDEVPAFDVEFDLSFQLAPLVQIDAMWHQSLLELQDEVYRLERLDAVFQAAVDQAGGEEGVA